MVPTIHISDTSKVALQQQLRGAYDAVQDAMTALEAAAPRCEDYQSPDVHGRADREHRAWTTSLEQMAHGLTVMWFLIEETTPPPREAGPARVPGPNSADGVTDATIWLYLRDQSLKVADLVKLIKQLYDHDANSTTVQSTRYTAALTIETMIRLGWQPPKT